MLSTKVKKNVWIILVVLVALSLIIALFVPLVAGYQ